jgi:hypothetical protein
VRLGVIPAGMTFREVYGFQIMAFEIERLGLLRLSVQVLPLLS